MKNKPILDFVCHKSYWPKKYEDDLYSYHVMEKQGLGYVDAWVSEFGNEVWIGNLNVRQEFRKKGIATALLDKVEELTNFVENVKYCVEVEPWAEQWLTDFYKKRGYTIIVRK